ncbi:MAG: hypothetical protein ACLR0U_19860 [Enterocloster clostridioformis]
MRIWWILEKEIDRLKGEEKRLAGELARSRGMLGSVKFVSRAPEAKIAESAQSSKSMSR